MTTKKKKMNKKQSDEKTETVLVMTLRDAVGEALRASRVQDPLCFLGDAYCPVEDLMAFLAALPSGQAALRRYVVSAADITNRKTGEVASRSGWVQLLPAHVVVPHRADTVRVNTADLAVLFALESMAFWATSPGWPTLPLARLTAVGKKGLSYELTERH